MGLIAMKCPNCGADIQLDDSREFGFCNFCGTKVMQEKIVVEHQGSVKVDNSEFVQKYLQNARRAKEKEDWAEVEKYYNLVEQNEPDNIEAIFYSAYGKAKQSLVSSDLYQRQSTFKILQNCVSILDDNYDISKEKDEIEAILTISDDIFAMAASEYVYNQRKNGYGIVVWSDKDETQNLFNALGFEFMKTLVNIASKYSSGDNEKKAIFYRLALKHGQFILEYGKLKYPNDNTMEKDVMTCHRLLHEVDPSHEMPTEPPKSKGGCYVATAVYGSYDCPEVWTLRRYRDDELAKTWYGRAFIHTYYAISPTLVAWFGHTEWFKKMWKGKLDRMVERLQSEGVESTPYNDKDWQ